MFIRFGDMVFAASEFRRLEWDEDGTATLHLAGEPDGIVLSRGLADDVNRFFQERHEPGAGAGGLDVYLATSPAIPETSPRPVKRGHPCP